MSKENTEESYYRALELLSRIKNGDTNPLEGEGALSLYDTIISTMGSNVDIYKLIGSPPELYVAQARGYINDLTSVCCKQEADDLLALYPEQNGETKERIKTALFEIAERFEVLGQYIKNTIESRGYPPEEFITGMRTPSPPTEVDFSQKHSTCPPAADVKNLEKGTTVEEPETPHRLK